VPDRETISAQELAAYWGVTPVSIFEAAMEGTIPGLIPGGKGRKLFFNKEEVLADWIPSRLREWTRDLQSPGRFMAKGSELTVDGGRTAIHNAAVARLHHMHVIVTPEKWTRIITKAVQQAIGGDRHARKWISDYLMGPPVQRVEAEVEVKTKQSFTDEMRARAIEALLASADARKVVIDVEPNEPRPNTN